jgi:uncharacterized membrane protein (UPF0136 family)
MQTNPDQTRANIAFVLLIVIGLAIGFLIKRVHIGLIIGLGLGLMASGMLRRRKR